MKKRFGKLVALTSTILLIGTVLGGCSGSISSSSIASDSEAIKSQSVVISANSESNKPTTIMLAAAASLEYSFEEELVPMFEAKYPWITVQATYDSSGKLQTQIEEGLNADVFMSAAEKQMSALVEKDLIIQDSVTNLLENELVLIVPSGSTTEIKAFEDVTKIQHLAVGDPESVPVGQYAKEALTSLGIWEEVAKTASYATNVTEVLNWVAEGSSEAGIVYATDAATTDKVTVVASAPQGSLEKKILYPVGILTTTQHKDEAQLFEDFLKTEEALAIFEKYGFTANI